ncbi:hypothetical protein D9619_010182 [Psilocybe cf. subviscida]|uniref:Uncharacterized protein n=1 Tax=Psilocybe cf. subviscida TaxID=2480587 RepID=A0A8H5ATY6_9AGAR|nr:hypothetical protein D9619_010182 [Psilocybe cf. subviscida]
MVTPIYHDVDAFGQQPPSGGGSDRVHRSNSGRGRRYYDADYDDYAGYDRGRRFRNDGRRGSSPSPSYRGQYSDDEYDYNDRGRASYRRRYSPESNYNGYGRGRDLDDEDDIGDRKRSRVPGTEPPPLAPPDISYYPGGSRTMSSPPARTQGYAHGRGGAQSLPYGQHDSTYGPYDQPHQSTGFDRGRPRGDAYASGYGRGGPGRRVDYGDPDGYPSTSDYGPGGYYQDDDSYSYTSGGGRSGRLSGQSNGNSERSGYAKRSRPEGTEPPKLPPPDISAYPGGGGRGGGGAHGVPGVHQGAGPPPSTSGSNSAGHTYGGSQHPPSQGYAGSQYSQPSGYSQPQQQHPQQRYPQGKKPGLIGRIFHSGSAHRG